MHNKHAVTLAILASKIDVLEETVDVKVIKRILWGTTVDLVLVDLFYEKDWGSSITWRLYQPSWIVAAKNLKCLSLLMDIYHWGIGGVLAQTLSLTATKEELWQIHALSYGQNDISLYDLSKGKDFIGLRWPQMLLRCNCPIRNVMNLIVQASFLVQEARDWQPYVVSSCTKAIQSLICDGS